MISSSNLLILIGRNVILELKLSTFHRVQNRIILYLENKSKLSKHYFWVPAKWLFYRASMGRCTFSEWLNMVLSLHA